MSESSVWKKPNILFITTDYQSGEDGPSLGHKFLDMPVLDRLCREGMVFTRYFSTAPICMPARYTLITGQYPHTHGQWDNQDRWIPADSPVLMELLKEAGYNTIGVGKMHFFPWDRMAGYDRRIIADRKGNWIGDNQYKDDYAIYLAEHGLTRWDYLKLQEPADIFGVYDWPFEEKLHIDVYVGDQARGVIAQDELSEPWFMWVSFNGPHNPWDPPAEYSTPYLELDLPVGSTFEGELKTKPRDHTRVRYNYTRPVVDRIDRDRESREKVIRRIRAGHYGNLTLIDRQLEKIMKALEEKGELDNTVIIYSADHGCSLGDHDLIHKGTHYDSDARVPFIVRYPPVVKPGRVNGFAGHIDFLPTILSITGSPAPNGLEGKDLTPILSGRKNSVQDSVVIEIRHGTSIVTDRWKMGVHPRDGDGDLYDLFNDPEELNNLYERPEYEKIRRKLMADILGVNPCLEEEMKQELNRPDRKGRYCFNQGEAVPGWEAPYVLEKAILISAEVHSREPRTVNGVVLAQYGAKRNSGYCLYVKDGFLVMAVKVWGELTQIKASRMLPAGKSKVSGFLNRDGEMIIEINGKDSALGKAPGCIPFQPGHPDGFPTDPLSVGFTDMDYALGEYKLPGTFTAELGNVHLLLKD